MAFDVEIVFAGLCAYVFDSADLAAARRVDIVMPAAREPDLPVGNRIVEAHLPVVIADSADFGGPSGRVVIPIDGRDLRLAAEPAGGAAPFAARTGAGADSLAKVVALATIAPDFGAIDPVCLNPAPPEDRVATRVAVESGALETWELRDVAQRFGIAEEAPGPIAHRTRLVHLELRSFALRASRFGNSSDEMTLRFTPRGGGPVRLWIGNLCSTDLFELLGGAMPAIEQESNLIDNDFAAFYLLTAGAEDLPESLAVPEADHGGAGKTRCNQATLRRPN